jgi:Ca2+-binding RTX toxin-like protein
MKAFYGIVSAEITTAATNNTAAADFAQALMTANSATKLFDPSTIIGTYINGDGSYIAANDLASLTAAIQSEYDTFKTYASETVGDVFGTDTATNFAGAVVNMLTTGDDTETLTSASEIIPTFDGTDTVYAGGGNDKVIGGSDLDTFYGQDGNDHLYGFRGDDILDGGDGNDKIVGGLGDDQISGGAGDDVLSAQTGDDTISTGTGTDQVYGGLGDDDITVDGTGDKTIDGGSGSDTLSISYNSYVLSDFSLSYANGYFHLTDPLDATISFKNIETFSISGSSYKIIYDGTDGSTEVNQGAGFTDVSESSADYYSLFNNPDMRGWDNNIISSALYSDADDLIQLFSFDTDLGSNFTIPSLSQYGFSEGDDITINGTPGNDTVSDRNDQLTGSVFTISTYDGDDAISLGSALPEAHIIDAGSGNDFVYVAVEDNTNYYLSYASIDGGDGSDWLHFSNTQSDTPISYIINDGNTSGFENVFAGYGDDNLTGDSNSNILVGGAGADILVGGDGADELYGYVNINPRGASDGNDNLSGGLGNDIIVGGAGDDTIIGGEGADVLTGDGGSKDSTGGYSDTDDYTRGGAKGVDTFVLQRGHGGASESEADLIIDFQDDTDLIGLNNGLLFSDLIIEQGSGNYLNDTIIKAGDEYLAVLQNFDNSLLDELIDFTPVDIA